MVLAETIPVSGPKRILPRVSKAKGGPSPGYENLRYSEIVAIEDAEYVERMKRGFK